MPAIKCAFEQAATRHIKTKMDTQTVEKSRFPSVSINTEHEKSFDGVGRS